LMKIWQVKDEQETCIAFNNIQFEPVFKTYKY